MISSALHDSPGGVPVAVEFLRKGLASGFPALAISGDSAHTGTMAKSTPTITFNPQPLKAGHEWQVIATYPRGQQEHITGFKTETEAKDWIAKDSKTWLRKRGYADD
jgi:hypothetical protein